MLMDEVTGDGVVDDPGAAQVQATEDDLSIVVPRWWDFYTYLIYAPTISPSDNQVKSLVWQFSRL